MRAAGELWGIVGGGNEVDASIMIVARCLGLQKGKGAVLFFPRDPMYVLPKAKLFVSPKTGCDFETVSKELAKSKFVFFFRVELYLPLIGPKMNH